MRKGRTWLLKKKIAHTDKKKKKKEPGKAMHSNAYIRK